MNRTTNPELDEAFPPIPCGLTPLGSRVIVQFRSPKKKSTGGIIFVEETKEIEKDNTQIARVVAVGPLAFRNRNTMEQWREGAWCEPGDFVRVPRYGGDRWEASEADRTAVFAVFDDLNLIGVVTGNPLAFKAFI